jgi:hypothetical protein
MWLVVVVVVVVVQLFLFYAPHREEVLGKRDIISL